MSAGQGGGTLPDLVVSQLYTAVVSDILDDLGHRDHVLDSAIRPLGPGEVIAGPANPFLVAEVRQIPAEPHGDGACGNLCQTCGDDYSGGAHRTRQSASEREGNC